MSKKISLLIILIFSFFLLSPSYAYDLSTPNNKYGIHLAQPSREDLLKAKELVNSNGGDWGYVTLVIQENDRDKNKWQETFDYMRELHLIPIIRLATEQEGAHWKRPIKEDADSWVEFLDSLHWVVKNRYIILFNEPNHATEWGGSVDVNSYADVAYTFAKKLKEKNSDFFVMLAGFDASAPASSPFYEDEATFLRVMFDHIQEDWSKYISGWSSHSYPNPAFSGSPYASGRGSVRTYDWEVSLVSQYGLKNLPVFITETGWEAARLSREQVANDYLVAFRSVWLPDDRVVAVTPFILNYQNDPFLNFSFAKVGNNDFYPQYYTLQDQVKPAGEPDILDVGNIDVRLPREIVINSNYHFEVNIENKGQALWDKDFNYHLEIEGYKPSAYFFSDIIKIKPNQKARMDLFLKTDQQMGDYHPKRVLMRGNKKIMETPAAALRVVGLPSLQMTVQLYPQLQTTASNFEVQIFNSHEELVFKRNSIDVTKNKAVIDEVSNVALGETYRIVVLQPFYLPRQERVTFTKGLNKVIFDKMVPLDFNNDGKFDLGDIGSLITNPAYLRMWLP